MKKGLIMLLTLVMAGSIAIAGCQKKEEPAPPPPAPAEQPAPPAEGQAPPAEGQAPAAPAAPAGK